VTTDAFHAQVKEAFSEALALDGDARRDFLAGLAQREPEVAKEVGDLLGHHDPDDTFLEESLLDRIGDEAPAAEALVGERVGRFTITGLIASGSMGAVYEAEQDEPRRAVAVKVLRAGAMSPRALRRFRYEAEVLGLLRHPGVAQIYEAGTHSDGALSAPYFAMELIPEARAVTRYAREEGLLLDARLALFIKICGAVHHGHQKGVIHRDLKPANLLVGTSGQPKVIDFGVARAVEDDASATVATLGGQLVGTLQYMSPEQLRPGGDDIDVRTDVYALGVVLYELVCDEPPHKLDGLSLVEAADLLRRKRVGRAGSVNPAARGDLEAIILKATEPERMRRYQSAEALATDVARFLKSEPVEASRPGLWRQFTLFARRRAGMVAGVGAVAAALIVATLISLWFAFAAGRAQQAETIARQEAQRSAQRAERVVTLLRDMIGVSEEGGDASVAKMLEEAVERLDEELEEDPLVEASLRLAIGQALHRLGRYAEAETQLRIALDERERLLGATAPGTLDAVGALSLTLAERGGLSEATGLADRLVSALPAEGGENPDRIAAALIVRAQLARRLGRPGDALMLYTRARRVVDQDSPQWYEARVGEAEIALERARPEDAIEALRSALPRATSSIESVPRLSRLIAEASRLSGNAPAAQTRMRTLVDVYRDELGPLHPETLLAQLELELALGGRSSNLAELESTGAAVLTSSSPVLSRLRDELAGALTRDGDLDGAVEVLTRRATGLAEADGSGRPAVVEAVIDVVDAMRRAGRRSAAAALGAEIRTTCFELYAEGAVPRARLSVVLGEIQRETGRPMITREELLNAARALSRQLGVQHPLTQRAAALLRAAPE